jgi:hypothetical protein
MFILHIELKLTFPAKLGNVRDMLERKASEYLTQSKLKNN